MKNKKKRRLLAVRRKRRKVGGQWWWLWSSELCGGRRNSLTSSLHDDVWLEALAVSTSGGRRGSLLQRPLVSSFRTPLFVSIKFLSIGLLFFCLSKSFSLYMYRPLRATTKVCNHPPSWEDGGSERGIYCILLVPLGRPSYNIMRTFGQWTKVGHISDHSDTLSQKPATWLIPVRWRCICIYPQMN